MNTSKNFTLKFIFNIIVWICFFLLPFVFFPYNRELSPFQSSRFVGWLIFSNIFLLIFYYVNSMVLVPQLLANKKTLWFIFIIVVSFCIYLLGIYLISEYTKDTREYLIRRGIERRRPPRSFFFISMGPMALFLLAFIASSGSRILDRWYAAEKIKEQIAQQQIHTELTMLKSQVNPHFLFNTLNSIYTLALTNDAKTPDAVLRLSRIMRYTLEESKSESVALKDEIEFIHSYIILQKMRLTDNVQVSFTIDGDPDFVTVPPLLFIPFIENAFKYGVSTHHRSEIRSTIQLEDGWLVFTCANDIFKNMNEPKSTGLGIENARRRLELLFGKNFLLTHEENDGKFILEMRFPLSTQSDNKLV